MRSMTGFARQEGEVSGMGWAWEARSVNARNLDLRVRLPDGAERLDPLVRAALKGRVQRGSVTIGLRYTVLARQGGGEGDLDALLSEIAQIEARAQSIGVDLQPSRASDVLALLRAGESAVADYSWIEPAGGQIGALIDALVDARAAEGRELLGALDRALSDIRTLVAEARSVTADRGERMAANLRARLADLTEGVDPARLEQEIAMLAVKADVAEELDRLGAHIVAAEMLLKDKGAVGRKFDFLMQEFNREANTLAAKSQDADLTRIALALKVVIDQMREQVQNVE